MIRALPALLLLSLPLAAGDVTLRLERGLPAVDLVPQAARATGIPTLYAPSDLEGKALSGSLEVAVAEDHAFDLLRFVLASTGLTVRRLEGPEGPLALVVPADALEGRLRLTGFDTPVEFSRSPGSWKGDADLPDCLTPATASALLGALETPGGKGRPEALLLLGLFGPRTPEVAGRLAKALADDALARRAAWALERFGWFGRPALEALKGRAAAGGPDAALFARVAEGIAKAFHPGLLQPSSAIARSPDVYDVDFTTTKGTFRVRVHRDWAPKGADRFFNLVRFGFYDDTAFFRVRKGFVVQFGLSGHPEVNRVWYGAKIDDDPVKTPNRKGTVSFATSGKDSRTTQVFVNMADNGNLDAQGFSPIGEVVEGMEVVESLHSGYGEKPDQDRIHFYGASYLREEFPDLDWIRAARVVER